MKATNIKVSPFEFVSYTRCDIDKEPNTHGKAIISGVIAEENEAKYIKQAQQDIKVRIIGISEKSEERVLFCGEIEDAFFDTVNNVSVLTLELVTATTDMDQVEHSRSFQDDSLQYSDVLKALGNYKGYDFIMQEEKQKISGMIVQYRETDWDFAKRLASQLNTVVIPEYTSGTPRFHFGVPKLSGTKALKSTAFTIQKPLGEFRTKAGKHAPISENAVLGYVVPDRELYDIGQKVSFMGENMVVYAIRNVWEGQELMNYYTLRSTSGFTVARQPHEKVAGASLFGKVCAVQRDVVQVELDIDKSNPACGKRWFSYSTVYSTPDGTGWYAMPEVGDEIRLHFPSNEEMEAYVISAVHLEASVAGARSIPDNKSMRNKYNKEVLLAPEMAMMTNNNGMSVTIDDAQGIIIESDKDVSLTAQGALNMTSVNSAITITGSTAVKIYQNSSSVELEDEVFFRGTQVHIQ